MQILDITEEGTDEDNNSFQRAHRGEGSSDEWLDSESRVATQPVGNAPVAQHRSPSVGTSGATEAVRSEEEDIATAAQFVIGDSRAVLDDAQMRCAIAIKQGCNVFFVASPGRHRSTAVYAAFKSISDSLNILFLVLALDNVHAHELCGRAKALGFTSCIWSAARRAHFERITIVTASEVGSEFLFEGMRQAEYWLMTVWIDRAESLEVDGRYVVYSKDIRMLLDRADSVIFTSDGYPPVDVSRLITQVGISEATTITANESAPLAYYDIVKLERPYHAVKLVRSEVETALALPGERVVVYMRSKGECRSIANVLGCSQYHDGMSVEERRQVKDQFVLGAERKHRVLCATATFDYGLTQARVTTVVWYLEAPSLFALAQVLRRLGREKRNSCGIIVRIEGNRVCEVEGAEAANAVYDDDQACLRQFVDTTATGEGSPCSSHGPGVVMCGRCAKVYVK